MKQGWMGNLLHFWDNESMQQPYKHRQQLIGSFGLELALTITTETCYVYEYIVRKLVLECNLM